MKEQRENIEVTKRKKRGIIVGIVLVVLVLLGASYAWLSLTLTGKKSQTLVAGTLSLELDETSSEGINIDNAVPVLDEVGQGYSPYTFALKNNGSLDSDYSIWLDDVDLLADELRLEDRMLRYEFFIGDQSQGIKVLSDSHEDGASRPENYSGPLRLLTSGTIKAGTTQAYSLKLWIGSDQGNDTMGKVFRARLRVEASQRIPKLAVNQLIDKANKASVTAYTAGNKGEMYTFTHDAGAQQSGWTAEELTDYRYIGNTPNNYVTFNDETWRIIGVFTVEDGHGNKEKRIKLIRDARLEPYLRWDSAITSESDEGKNRWSDSQLQKLLNPGYESEANGGSLYWNSAVGNCYGSTTVNDETTNGTEACNFTNNGLRNVQDMIADTKYYLGGSASDSGQSGPTYYASERGTTVYNSSSYPRETNWIGKVGLMYPSDYAYTYALGVNDRCYTDTYSCDSGTPASGWLYNGSYSQWTITPKSDVSFRLFYLFSEGTSVTKMAYYPSAVRPVVYLKANTQITSGTGSSADPYLLS